MDTTTELREFQGRMITKTTIAVRKAGDGLSAAQKVEPVDLKQGDKVYVVLETTVGRVSYKPIEDRFEEECFDLVCDAATIIDESAVHDALALTKERIRLEEERAAGVQRLPTTDALHGDHYLGLHKGGLVEGCPDCAEEIDAIDQEQETDGD